MSIGRKLKTLIMLQIISAENGSHIDCPETDPFTLIPEIPIEPVNGMNVLLFLPPVTIDGRSWSIGYYPNRNATRHLNQIINKYT
jgi:hypothetical protein